MTEFEAMARKHWEKYLPGLVRELKRERKYNQEIKETAKEAREQLSRLVQRGAQYAAAREWVLNEYILLPPETNNR